MSEDTHKAVAELSTAEKAGGVSAMIRLLVEEAIEARLSDLGERRLRDEVDDYLSEHFSKFAKRVANLLAFSGAESSANRQMMFNLLLYMDMSESEANNLFDAATKKGWQNIKRRDSAMAEIGERVRERLTNDSTL